MKKKQLTEYTKKELYTYLRYFTRTYIVSLTSVILLGLRKTWDDRL